MPNKPDVASHAHMRAALVLRLGTERRHRSLSSVLASHAKAACLFARIVTSKAGQG